MTIAVLVPTLGRPHRARPLLDSLRDSTSSRWRVIFVLSPGDTDGLAAAITAKTDDPEHVNAYVAHWEAGPGDYQRKINYAAACTRSPWLFTGADDLRFHPGWDTEALRTAAETGALVIGTNDLNDPALRDRGDATHSLVHRSYFERGTIDEFNQLLHEGYQHYFCDTELVATAKARGVYAYARDSVVEHLHPVYGKAPRDATYDLLSARDFDADASVYREREPLWLT